MKSELLMEAIAEISDAHIAEFADEKPRKRHAAVWISAISAAACLALIFAVPPVRQIILAPYYNNMVNSSNEFNNAPLSPNIAAVVRINDTLYEYSDRVYDHVQTERYDLPEGYLLIGKVLSNGSADYNSNGYSSLCEPGDEIYQDPECPNEIYVHTRLYNCEGYWYLLFIAK